MSEEFKCDRGCEKKFTHQESLDFHYGDGCNFKDIIKAQKKEIQSLKEQLARMGEAVHSVVDEATGDLKNQSKRIWALRSSTHRALRKSLSSYDPKWIEGVRVEAKSGGVASAISAILNVMHSAELKQRGDRAKCTRGWIHLIESSLHRIISEKSRQPNQSREKRG